MSEPKMKVNLRVTTVLWNARAMFLTADAEYAKPLNKYGKLTPAPEPGGWTFTVDARYDFREVVDYVKSFETPIEPETVDDEPAEATE